MKTTLVFAPAFLLCAVAAQTASIAVGQPAHIRSEINSTLCMGTVGTPASGDSLSLITCGNGSSTDFSALTVTKGSGASSQLLLPGSNQLCITSQNASPSADVTVATCADDSAQLWTVNSNGTLSSAGNCLTVGKAALGAPVTLTGCDVNLERQQVFNITAADGSPSPSLPSSTTSSTASSSATSNSTSTSSLSSGSVDTLLPHHTVVSVAVFALISLYTLR